MLAALYEGGALEADTLEGINKAYGCGFRAGVFGAALLKLDHSGHVEESERELLYQKLMDAAQKLYVPHLTELVCGVHNATLVLVLNAGAGQITELEKLHAAFFEGAKNQVRQFGFYTATLGLGSWKPDILEAGASVQEARSALRRRIQSGTLRILACEPDEAGAAGRGKNAGELLSPALKAQLLTGVKSGDAVQLREWFSAAEGAFRAALAEGPDTLFALCLHVSKLLHSFVWDNVDPAFGESTGALRAALEDASTFRDVMALLQEHVAELAEYCRRHNRQEPAIIQEVKDYIRSHYQKQVKLEDAAARVHTSPTYLSILFKQMTGENFTDCLIHVRMDAAKELLRSSDKNMSDVAAACGYNDTKHFSRQFHKIVGILPSAYRKLYR